MDHDQFALSNIDDNDIIDGYSAVKAASSLKKELCSLGNQPQFDSQMAWFDCLLNDLNRWLLKLDVSKFGPVVPEEFMTAPSHLGFHRESSSKFYKNDFLGVSKALGKGWLAGVSKQMTLYSLLRH